MCRRQGRRASCCREFSGDSGQAGYNLVVLMVMITIMSIVVAVMLPAWTQFVRREKESELIFRGMQYAEAIRVFQQRQGRLPIRLEELVEVEPRSIRQLYDDPMSDSGKWGLLIQGAQPTQGGQGRPGPATPAPPDSPDSMPPNDQNAPGANPSIPGGVGVQGRTGGNMVAVPPATEDEFGRPNQRTTGPIVGVYSATDEQSLRTFFGQNKYEQWQFHVGLIPTPVMLGGDNPAPRVHSNWVGKPFRSDLQAAPAAGAPAAAGQDLTSGKTERRGLAPSSFRPKPRSP